MPERSLVLRDAVLALAFMTSLAQAEPARPLFEPAGPGKTAPASELSPGDLFPDAALTSQTGATVHPRDFRGQPLALTFFYSRCAAAEFCPLVSRNFDTAQALLLRLGLAGRCHLLSISLDPAHDTPEVLAAYARSSGAEAELWSFATGREDNLKALGDSVGLQVLRNGDRIDHNLRTVVLDAEGRIRHIFRGNSWTPQELVAALRAAERVRK